eukprot:7777406-Pyramimonas_sp.AAC.1
MTATKEEVFPHVIWEPRPTVERTPWLRGRTISEVTFTKNDWQWKLSNVPALFWYWSSTFIDTEPPEIPDQTTMAIDQTSSIMA